MRKLSVLTIVVFVIMAAFTSCGGGNLLDGTYVLEDGDGLFDASLIISGNKFKVEVDGRIVEERTFELVVKQKEKGYCSGAIILIEDGYQDEAKFEFDGYKLTIEDDVFIKKNATPQKAGKSRSVGSGGSNIGKQAAEDICECSKVDGFAALTCLGAWIDKYEEYLVQKSLEEMLKEPVFKDKNIQKDFEKNAEKCKKR
ncbi:MAG: hypothetical protein FWF09_06405 [Bacteroidales bacterium]|nr:hypothetical protein [Bacteroidales bacterium]